MNKHYVWKNYKWVKHRENVLKRGKCYKVYENNEIIYYYCDEDCDCSNFHFYDDFLVHNYSVYHGFINCNKEFYWKDIELL